MNDDIFVESVEENKKWSIPVVPGWQMVMCVIYIVMDERIDQVNLE